MCVRIDSSGTVGEVHDYVCMSPGDLAKWFQGYINPKTSKAVIVALLLASTLLGIMNY
jgi:hypothetical protein